MVAKQGLPIAKGTWRRFSTSVQWGSFPQHPKLLRPKALLPALDESVIRHKENPKREPQSKTPHVPKSVTKHKEDRGQESRSEKPLTQNPQINIRYNRGPKTCNPLIAPKIRRICNKPFRIRRRVFTPCRKIKTNYIRCRTVLVPHSIRYVLDARSNSLSNHSTELSEKDPGSILLEQVDSMLRLQEERFERPTESSMPMRQGHLKWSSLPHLKGSNLNISMPLGSSMRHLLLHPRHRIQTRIPNWKLSAHLLRHYTNTAPRNALSNVQKAARVGEEATSYAHPSSSKDIRDHLSIWQEHATSQASHAAPFKKAVSQLGDISNTLSQSGESISPDTIDEDNETRERKWDVTSMPTDDDFELSVNHYYLQKGDVVELVNNQEPMLAVLTRNFTEQSQFYTMYGTWCHLSPRKIPFFIPQMISPNEIDPIIPYLPDSEIPEDGLDRLQALGPQVPRAAGANIIRKMLVLNQSTNNVIRAYAGRLNRAHEIMSHPTERSHATLREIAMKVLQKDDPMELTECMLWAVHRAIKQSEHFLMNDIRHRLYPVWDVRSKNDAKSMGKVREWMREYNEALVDDGTGALEPTYSAKTNPFPGFFEIARSTIQESRRTRMVTQSGSIGPSLVRLKTTEPRGAVWKEHLSTYFTKDELMIIHFLTVWATSNTLGETPSFVSIGSMILRYTGMYENFPLDRSTGHVLLQELGIVPPWFNRASVHPNFPLPSHHGDPLSDRLNLQAGKSVAGFVMQDSMQSFRRDWGDLEVFCIDNADAHEIDDGISLEEIDGSSSTFWVHIHVANPSAFLGPNSPMGQYAAHLTQSVYYPERTYSLLPPEITQKHFSLATNRPCITFSAKMTTDGEIVDTQISHGILRNVTHITVEVLQSELEPDKEPKFQEIKFTVGGEMPSKPIMPKSPPMTTSQKSTLRKLIELGLERRKRRHRDGGNFMNNSSMELGVKVYHGPRNNAENQTGIFQKKGYRYEGDPIICFKNKIMLDTKQDIEMLSHQLVPDMMLIAGEVGALWCSKRNIPIPYRGTALNPDPPESPENFKTRVIDPAVKKDGVASIDDTRRYAKLLGRTVSSVRPLKHKFLGLEAYSQLTSPLRRYVDLMSHWQIEAAIRHEYRTGISLIGSTDDSYLTFSRSEAELIIERVFTREVVASQVNNWALRLWTAQLLFRAFHFKEAPLPDTFQMQCIFLSHSEEIAMGIINELVMTCSVQENSVTQRQGGIRIGDFWEVKLANIDCYKGRVSAEAIRLIERTSIQQP